MIVIISDITFTICAQGRKLNTPSAHSQKNTMNKQKPQTIYYMIKKTYFYMEFVSRWALGLWRGLSLIVDWSQSQDNWKPIFLFFFLEINFCRLYFTFHCTWNDVSLSHHWLKDTFLLWPSILFTTSTEIFSKKENKTRDGSPLQLGWYLWLSLFQKSKRGGGQCVGFVRIVETFKGISGIRSVWLESRVQVELEFSHPTVLNNALCWIENKSWKPTIKYTHALPKTSDFYVRKLRTFILEEF